MPHHVRLRILGGIVATLILLGVVIVYQNWFTPILTPGEEMLAQQESPVGGIVTLVSFQRNGEDWRRVSWYPTNELGIRDSREFLPKGNDNFEFKWQGKNLLIIVHADNTLEMIIPGPHPSPVPVPPNASS